MIDQEIERGREIMTAALKEVGIQAANFSITGVYFQLDHDPRLFWRAACIARAALGVDEYPWEEWCQDHRTYGPDTTAWLDKWGCP